MPHRNEKIANSIKELSAIFLEKANNRTSLITVTHADCSPDLKKAKIFVTVLPEEKEEYALEFLKRQRGELRNYLKQNLDIKNIPFVDIVLDLGEKNRQKIDELLRNS